MLPTLAQYEAARRKDAVLQSDIERMYQLHKQHSQGLLTNAEYLYEAGLVAIKAAVHN